MKYNKNKYLYASNYRENSIKIPISRLKTMLRPGDRIEAHTSEKMSASYVGYEVTQVAHWGVYAKPTKKFREGEKHRKLPGHYKIKWGHITGVYFAEEE